MIVHPESSVVASGGRQTARAAARMMALHARQLLVSAEEIIEATGDSDTSAVARKAGEATTALLVATYDGPGQTFACKRS